jgi:hypothetical protein
VHVSATGQPHSIDRTTLPRPHTNNARGIKARREWDRWAHLVVLPCPCLLPFFSLPQRSQSKTNLLLAYVTVTTLDIMMLE